MTLRVVTHTLSGAVATNGTFTVAYPPQTDSGYFVGGTQHVMTALGATRTSPGGFTLTFGTSDITVTYKGTTTLPAGTTVRIQLDTLGQERPRGQAVVGVVTTSTAIINLGAPDVADADGAVASQSISATTGLATGINGALAAGGVATFDVPRNVVGAWTTTAVMTVTGTDEYGVTIRESSASGATMTGKKAFKTVTAVSVSADVTLATVGTGDVLGLPVFLPQAALVFRELQDGAAATAGTVVAGVSSAATATTGDVRGTYDPNAAADGAKAFQLVAAIPDPAYKGVTQFGG